MKPVVALLLSTLLAAPALAVVSGDDGVADATWTVDAGNPQNAGITHFTIYSAEASGQLPSDYDQSDVISDPAARTAIITRPVFGAEGDTVTIFYRMTASDADGESALSNEVSKDFPITDGLPPMAPTIQIVVTTGRTEDLLGVNIAFAGFEDESGIPDIELLTQALE